MEFQYNKLFKTRPGVFEDPPSCLLSNLASVENKQGRGSSRFKIQFNVQQSLTLESQLGNRVLCCVKYI